MKIKEKAITGSNADRNERLHEQMLSEAPESPYNSDKYKQAVRYLKDNGIDLKPLRRSDDA